MTLQKTKNIEILNKLFNQNRYQEVIEKADKLKKEDIDDVDTLNLIAHSYARIGKIENSIDLFHKVLEINSENYTALVGLGDTLQEIGKQTEAISFYEKLVKKYPDDDIANYSLAQGYRKIENLKKAAFHYGVSNRRLSTAFQLECIYLDKNSDKKEFDKILDMSRKEQPNPLVASISKHAAIKNSTYDNYNFCSEPFRFIKKENLIENNLMDDDLINDLMRDINDANTSQKAQALIINGLQTSGNLFMLNFSSVKKIKEIIEKKIKLYREEFSDSEEGVIKYWPKDFGIYGWIITLKQGGELKPHIHKIGWVSSSIYLKRPKRKSLNDGDLKFSFDGAEYPSNGVSFPEKIQEINKGDIIMFPSSIFHSTIPFSSDEERITLAFDVIPD